MNVTLSEAEVYHESTGNKYVTLNNQILAICNIQILVNIIDFSGQNLQPKIVQCEPVLSGRFLARINGPGFLSIVVWICKTIHCQTSCLG